ncbi:hypothetical protein NSA19_05365 [Actinomyces bowdenii]|uniref:hypothetical protein n=1 Tax=Actinomyces bowdenii TaxID=131109 RepID=UPI00214B39C5|nr:hypothetical protein [Actinomyces bowdenii]MCR2052282.1 hypothetical protein [Actinomyces bowdenii]
MGPYSTDGAAAHRPTALLVLEDGYTLRGRAYGLAPVDKTVETCAAEFTVRNPYLYSTYDTETEAAARRERRATRQHTTQEPLL